MFGQTLATLAYSHERISSILFGFGILRLITATAVCILAFLPEISTDVLSIESPTALRYAAITHLLLSVLSMLISSSRTISTTAINVVLATDLLMLTLIMRFAGGVDSGFGNLMLISVGVGSLLLPLQQGLFIAAIAASALVYTEMIPLRTTTNNPVQAAILGGVFFFESLLLHYIGQRIRSSEQLNRTQADTIIDLRQLNELIVQRMRTGIIVITQKGEIRLLNDAARTLLDIPQGPVFWLSTPLIERLEHWRADHSAAIQPLQVNSSHPSVSVSFANFQQQAQSDIIIFLEHTGRIQQQAQELKLTSLGRLTASIAHEIRNPLGAISHAAQLLKETSELDEAATRLSNIIHRHTERVNTIIETILELSRRRPTRIETIALVDLINSCLEERELQTKKSQDMLKVDIPVQIKLEIDSPQIKQAIHNLINNGLRHSEKKTGRRIVYLRAGVVKNSQQHFLDVEDRGDGVAEENQKNLFEPFYTTEKDGIGLGLYIAKELCAANRLQLVYVSGKPGGCFRILFAPSIVTPYAKIQS